MVNCRSKYESCMKAPFASASVCAEQLVNCEMLQGGKKPKVGIVEVAAVAATGLCVWWLITRHGRF